MAPNTPYERLLTIADRTRRRSVRVHLQPNTYHEINDDAIGYERICCVGLALLLRSAWGSDDLYHGHSSLTLSTSVARHHLPYVTEIIMHSIAEVEMRTLCWVLLFVCAVRFITFPDTGEYRVILSSDLRPRHPYSSQNKLATSNKPSSNGKDLIS